MLEASPTLAMKYLILSLSLLVLTSCSHTIAPEVPEVLEVSHDDLVERCFTYQVDSDEPFTGRSVKFYESGKLENTAGYQDGKKEGLNEWYWENGNLGQTGSLKNGKKDGLFEMFSPNGKLIRSVIYENGVPIKK